MGINIEKTWGFCGKIMKAMVEGNKKSPAFWQGRKFVYHLEISHEVLLDLSVEFLTIIFVFK